LGYVIRDVESWRWHAPGQFGSLAGMAESARRNEFRGLFLSIPKHLESRVDVLLPCPRIRGTVKQELSDSATMPTVN
jgi:hypothetical protein